MREVQTGIIQTPSAGQGFSYVFSQIQKVRLLALICTLTTDAVVANRFFWATVTDLSGNIVWESGNPNAQAASAVSQYILSPQFGQLASINGPVNVANGIPWPDFWMPEGWKVSVGARGMDVADTFTAITFMAEFATDEWDIASREAQMLAYLAAQSNG